LKTYIIHWRKIRYGNSAVEANNIEEARKKANMPSENFDWEELDLEDSWQVNDIEEEE